MEDQSASSARHYARSLSIAVDVVSTIVEAYDDEGDEPDATIADYITTEMVGDQNVPAPLWDLLSGLVNLTHLLLGRVEELSNTSKQDVLEWYADAAAQMADGDIEPE